MYPQGANQYQAVSNQTSVVDADPHKLIQLLFEGALARISRAKGCLKANDFEGKNNAINAAIRIIGGLQDSLDMDAGELSENLQRLYEYCSNRLFEANIKNSMDMLEEVSSLLLDIKSAWDEIRDEALNIFQSNGQAMAAAR